MCISPFLAHINKKNNLCGCLYQKPKTLQSVPVGLVLHLGESNKIDKLFFLLLFLKLLILLKKVSQLI